MATAESRAFQSQFSTLISAIDNPLTTAAEAYSRDLISRDIVDKMLVSTLTTKEKAAILLTSVESHVSTNQQSFHEFVRVLKTQTNLVQTAENLQMEYWKYRGEQIQTATNLENVCPVSTSSTGNLMIQSTAESPMPTTSQPKPKRIRLDDSQVQSQGMCNFQQQSMPLQQFFRQQPSPVSGMQPGGHIRGNIGGQFSGENQQDLGYSQPQYGVQHPPLSQPHYTTPQQSYLLLPSGQFTGETQGA